MHVAKQVMEQIIESGTVIRGWLGVSMQDMAPELYESLDTDQKTGSLVAEILYLVAALAPGETVNVTVIRNDERKDISIKVGVRPRQQ